MGMTELTDCPTCGRDDFDSGVAVKIHHNRSHGESIAGVEVKCSNCGDSITRPPHEVERSDRSFCDKSCRGEYERNRVEVECAQCGRVHKQRKSRAEGVEKHFCDRECQMRYWEEQKTVECECSVCGGEIKRRASHAKKCRDYLCSTECRSEWNSDKLTGENAPNYRGGISDYGPGWNPNKKEQVRERDGRECQHCGLSEEKHIEKFGEKHSVHHIKPARKVDDPNERNAPSNLITLCRSPCHAIWEQMAPLRPDTASSD